ncbi:MAG: hypothetical protein ACP5N2_01380 [Candidatus Nanoarchaeia archaeon]
MKSAKIIQTNNSAQSIDETIQRLKKTIPKIIAEDYYHSLPLFDDLINSKSQSDWKMFFNNFTWLGKYERDINKHRLKLYTQNKENIVLLYKTLENIEKKNPTLDTLNEISAQLEHRREEYALAFISHKYTAPSLYEVLFQFESFVKKEATPLIETPSKNLSRFWGPISDFSNCLNKYALEPHVQPIAKKIIVKLGEVAKIDYERGENRRISYASISSGTSSTATHCMSEMTRLLKSLNLPPESAYDYVSLTKQQIEQYQKTYNDR